MKKRQLTAREYYDTRTPENAPHLYTPTMNVITETANIPLKLKTATDEWEKFNADFAKKVKAYNYSLRDLVNVGKISDATANYRLEFNMPQPLYSLLEACVPKWYTDPKIKKWYFSEYPGYTIPKSTDKEKRTFI